VTEDDERAAPSTRPPGQTAFARAAARALAPLPPAARIVVVIAISVLLVLAPLVLLILAK
jgi:hypothetical protein